MIPGYLDGSDITFMNSFYEFPKKIETSDGKAKWTNDSLTLIYRDNKTCKKNHVTIESPDYEYYVVKDEKDHKNYNRLFIEKDKVEKVSCPYNKLEKDIAERMGQEKFYNDNIRSGARALNRQLHALPDVFFSDTNIEDHYRFRFGRLYTNNTFKIHKAYFDIEVDGKYQAGDFPEMGECPINCVSYLDEKENKVYTFILRNPENPLIEEFEKSLNSNIYKELYDFIIKNVGGIKKATKFGIVDISQEFLFFDDEISMIAYMFQLFHTIDPDFILAWNMAFDIPYVIERIKELGYNPEDIMCNKNFEVKVAKYYIDTRNQNEFAERTDFATISGNITWLDQMLQYAQRRKAKSASFASFKLDDIGLLTCGVKKLDYSHITNSVIKLPYLDFKTFVFYNIMDVIVQKCIESVSNDIEYIFTKCLVNNTGYRKGHRQTVYLANRMAKDFYNYGYIIGNNCNKWNEKPEEKYLGAMVGDPLNLTTHSMMKINDEPCMCANNLMDEDYKSLYPSVDIENNIAPNTQVGKIIIPDKVYKNENRYNQDKYSRSGEFIENMVTDNILDFMERYFNLADFKEILEDIEEYDKTFGIGVPLDIMFGYGIRFNAPEKTEAINFNYSKRAIKFVDTEMPYKDEWLDTIRGGLNLVK